VLTDILLAEGERQLTVCNACRYCEAYCAVFPALELRREVGQADVVQLANLCHDCRACYYACMYAAPHEFAINIPKVLSAVRAETYTSYAWPRVLSRVFSRGAVRTIVGSLLVTIAICFVISLWSKTSLVGTVTGANSFYELVPYALMIGGFGGLALYIIGVTVAGALRFSRRTHGRLRDLIDGAALRTATREALNLRYLRGGGDGCYYPADEPSMRRRTMHSLVFYGFVLAFCATVTAAVMQDVLGIPPPYGFTSAPVILGSVGGAMMIIGTTVLTGMKRQRDHDPDWQPMTVRDYGFLVSLNTVSVTGFLVLALRNTPALGIALSAHLGGLVILFLSMPYGKFVHFAYRYVALVQNAIEMRTADNAHVDAAGAAMQGE
jgi:citrate/tricarballylate utilization protein